jgi:hypothetical protein
VKLFIAAVIATLCQVGVAAAQVGRPDVTNEVDRFGEISAALVARDVGPDRWSIRLDLTDNDATTGIASGIVTDPEDPGAPTVFLECITTDIRGPEDDPDEQEWEMECFGNTRCEERGDCPDWELLDVVEVPGSFWLPPN